MKPETSVLPPSTTFPLPSLPSLNDVTQRFWEQLLGGLGSPQAGGEQPVRPSVGGTPWK